MCTGECGGTSVVCVFVSGEIFGGDERWAGASRLLGSNVSQCSAVNQRPRAALVVYYACVI